MLAADAMLPVNFTLGVVLAGLLLAAMGVAAFTHLVHDDGRRHARRRAGRRARHGAARRGFAGIGWVIGAVPTLLGFVALVHAVAVRPRIRTSRRTDRPSPRRRRVHDR